jgi:hypothetical protein
MLPLGINASMLDGREVAAVLLGITRFVATRWSVGSWTGRWLRVAIRATLLVVSTGESREGRTLAPEPRRCLRTTFGPSRAMRLARGAAAGQEGRDGKDATVCAVPAAVTKNETNYFYGRRVTARPRRYAPARCSFTLGPSRPPLTPRNSPTTRMCCSNTGSPFTARPSRCASAHADSRPKCVGQQLSLCLERRERPSPPVGDTTGLDLFPAPRDHLLHRLAEDGLVGVGQEVAVHGPRVTVVRLKTRCGSLWAIGPQESLMHPRKRVGVSDRRAQRTSGWMRMSMWPTRRRP